MNNEDKSKNTEIKIRINENAKEYLQEIAEKNYFDSLSEYLRYAGFKCSNFMSNGNMSSLNKLNENDNLKIEEKLRSINSNVYNNSSYENIVVVTSKDTEEKYLSLNITSGISFISLEKYLNSTNQYENKAIFIYPSVLLSFLNENNSLRQDINLLSRQVSSLSDDLNFDINKYLNENSVESSIDSINNILIFACNNGWDVQYENTHCINYTKIITNKGDIITFIYDKNNSKYYLQKFDYNKDNNYEDFKSYLLSLNNSVSYIDEEQKDIMYLLNCLGIKKANKKYISEEKMKSLLEYIRLNEQDHWVVNKGDTSIKINTNDLISDDMNGLIPCDMKDLISDHIDDSISIFSTDLSLNIILMFYCTLDQLVENKKYGFKKYLFDIFVAENKNIEWENHNDINNFLNFLNADSDYSGISEEVMKLSNRKICKLPSKITKFNKCDYEYKIKMALDRKDLVSIEKNIKKVKIDFLNNLLNNIFTNDIMYFSADNMRFESFYYSILDILLAKKIKFDPYFAILYSIKLNRLDFITKIITLLKDGYKIKSDYFSKKLNLEKPLYKQLTSDFCQCTIALQLFYLFESGSKNVASFIKILHDAGFILNLPLIFKNIIYTDEFISLLKNEFGNESFDIFNNKETKHDKNIKHSENIKHEEETNEKDLHLLYEQPNEYKQSLDSIEYENELLNESMNKIIKMRSTKPKAIISYQYDL